MPQKRLLRTGLLAAAAAATLALAVTTSADNAAAGDRAYPDSYYVPGPAQAVEQIDAIVGKPMPSINSAEGWINGEVTDESLKGNIVLLDIWATWCGPCIASIPHNNEIVQKYGDQGVKVVGISSSPNGQEKTEQVAQRHGIEYPVARDPGSQIAQAYNLQWYPHYIVIDRQGTVRAAGLSPDGAESVVKELLEEQPKS